MAVLSVSEESNEILRRLRAPGESDEDLLKRVVDYARCFMIIYGAEAERAPVEA